MSQVEQPAPYHDPIVEEVRAIREAIDEEVGHDVARLAERARRVGEEYRRQRGLEAAQVPSSQQPRQANE